MAYEPTQAANIYREFLLLLLDLNLNQEVIDKVDKVIRLIIFKWGVEKVHCRWRLKSGWIDFWPIYKSASI